MKTSGCLIALALLSACSDGMQVALDAGAPPDAPPPVIVEIRADTNRNGAIDWDDPTEATGKDAWTRERGAIFLANIDDDESACPQKNPEGGLLTDLELPQCNDAADTIVNGEADLLDLAPIATRPWASAPEGAVGTLAVDELSASRVHLFKQDAEGSWVFFDPSVDTLSAAELRAGARFAIEATDVVRDKDAWDGVTHVTFAVGDRSDRVALRVAPMITRHHLDPARRVFFTRFGGQQPSAVFESTLMAGMSAIKGSLPSGFVRAISASERYGSSTPYADQWTQDFFETAYMSMPAPEGKQHVIDVYLRSANVYAPSNEKSPLRPAGKAVFLKFRGPDAAGVQEFDLAGHDLGSDTLNSFGNFETVPPFPGFPLGRVVQGNVQSFATDPAFTKMIESQGVQDPIYVDTSWLLVAHIDETISFVRAPTKRGWVVLANDPALAKKMLSDAVLAGHGDALMFEGLSWSGSAPAQRTIAEVLADTDILTSSASAAAAIDSQLAILKKETGLGDDEIIRVPFLHWDAMGGSIAYQPGTVNGLSFADDGFAAPDPHGPVIDGKDIFKKQLEEALGPIGVKVAWVENWDLYHALAGEVHCGTNTLRAVPETTRWWGP